MLNKRVYKKSAILLVIGFKNGDIFVSLQIEMSEHWILFQDNSTVPLSIVWTRVGGNWNHFTCTIFVLLSTLICNHWK